MFKTGLEAICLSLDLSTSTSTSTSDAAAKSALSFPITRMKLHATDMYPRITKLIFDEWQEVWDCCTGTNCTLLDLLYVTTIRKHVYRGVIQYC